MKVFSMERGLRELKPDITLADYRAKYPTAIEIKKVPTLATLKRWDNDGMCKTPDGCKVEPDGMCEHGYPSWLLIMGWI